MRAPCGDVTEVESTLFPGLRPEKVAPAGQIEHTNPTRKRGVFNPFRTIKDRSLARRVSVGAGSVRRSILQTSTTNCRCARHMGLIISA